MADTTLATDLGALDPVTLEVIRHGIVSITDQIDANITRTAFSPYIYEYKDYAVGMTDADGRAHRAMRSAACRSSWPTRSAWRCATGSRSTATSGSIDGDVVVCNHAASRASISTTR